MHTFSRPSPSPPHGLGLIYEFPPFFGFTRYFGWVCPPPLSKNDATCLFNQRNYLCVIQSLFLLGLSCFVHDTKLFFEIENEREGRKLNIYFNQESQQGIPWLTTIILEMHLQFEICDVTYLNWSLTVLLFNGSELTFLVEQNQTFAALSLIYVSE